MLQVIKQMLRPLYRLAVRNPVMRAFVVREARELGPRAWEAQVVASFIESDCGAAYGLDKAGRRALVAAFENNVQAIESGTTVVVHVLLAQEVLSLAPDVKGDVVECGVWKGASSASLSLVCKLVGRRLKVCDSFQGLPDEGDERHTGMHTKVYGHYKAGMFAGALAEVQENIRAHGAFDVCDLVEGFFNESLGALQDPVAFAFLDVDLAGSTRDCLKAVWPLLVEGGTVYSDDAGDLDVVRVYFEEPWWQETLGCAAPGFVGSGCGLPLNPAYSSVGYTQKKTKFLPTQWRKVRFLHYPEE